MITIKLSQNGKHAGQFVAYIDDKHSELAKLRWSVLISKNGKTQYARDRKSVLLHILILESKLGRPIAEGMECDHIDGNGLNCLEENLREVTKSQNQWNKTAYANKVSKYKGVSWHKTSKKWRAQIRVNGKRKHLGYRETEEEAYQLYCDAAKEYHQQFANLG